MQPTLRSGTISLALCSMFGGCRSTTSPEATLAPEAKAITLTYANEVRDEQFHIPDLGVLSLKCTYNRQVTGAADRMSARFEGLPVVESVALAPISPGSYRLEAYHIISANSYRLQTTRVTGVEGAGKDTPLTKSDVVYAAKDVDERVLAGKVEATISLENSAGSKNALSTPLEFREGVPKDVFRTLWIEVFALDTTTSTERLVGAGSVGYIGGGNGLWVPSFLPEDVSKVGSPDSRVTSVRERFKLF